MGKFSFRKIILVVLVLLLGILFPNKPSYAVEYRRLGQDYRALAMGNTGIASSNNSSALFYNPATLANIQSWWVDFPMLELTLSEDAQALVDQAKKGSFTLNTQKEQFAFMQSFIGKNPYVKFRVGSNLFINILRRGLTVGYNYTYEAILDIEVRNPSMPEIHTFSRLDNIRQFGISIPLFLGKFIIGAVSKKIERTEIDFTYGMSQAINSEPFPTLANNGGSGQGSGYDIGFLYRMPSKSRIQFGGVVRQEIDLQGATKIPGETALGIAMIQQLAIFRIVGALDLRDLTKQAGLKNDKSINRRTHLGLEVGIIPLSRDTSLVSLRSGYSQGLKSAGAELSLGHTLVLGYAQYMEERGEFAGQKPSKRKTLYLSLGF